MQEPRLWICFLEYDGYQISFDYPGTSYEGIYSCSFPGSSLVIFCKSLLLLPNCPLHQSSQTLLFLGVLDLLYWLWVTQTSSEHLIPLCQQLCCQKMPQCQTVQCFAACTAHYGWEWCPMANAIDYQGSQTDHQAKQSNCNGQHIRQSEIRSVVGLDKCLQRCWQLYWLQVETIICPRWKNSKLSCGTTLQWVRPYWDPSSMPYLLPKLRYLVSPCRSDRCLQSS
jgi:hypothetical protein